MLPEVEEFKALFEQRIASNESANLLPVDSKERAQTLSKSVALLDEAKMKAQAFVSSNPARFVMYSTGGPEGEGMTREQVVGMLDAFRAAGNDEAKWLTEMWIMAEFEPLHIGGKFNSNLRRPDLASRRGR